MTEDGIRDVVLKVLTSIAPEVDPLEIAPDVELRDQIEVDSMDLLNLVIGVHEETGVEIPESDYPKLATIDAFVSYLAARIQ